MAQSIISDTTKISKKTNNIEQELSKICGGDIIRMAIIDITNDSYIVSYSYKTK